MKFGAIDIGTNAARLLIGEVARKGKRDVMKKISYVRIPLRLGLEVFETGVISGKKEGELTQTIEAFRLLSEVFGVTELRACATSAMREAQNGEMVQQRIQEKTGVTVEIISGMEEAELILSTFFLLDFDQKKPFLVVDVGGGSTEISIFKRGEKVTSRSFSVGTIRLLKEKVKPNVWRELGQWVVEHLREEHEYTTFATGGNINKVHKLMGKKSSEPITVRELLSFSEKIRKLSIEKRISEYQLKSDRADVIVPACDIYTFILKKISAQSVYVPKIGLSDGIVYGLHRQHNGSGTKER